MSGTTVTAAAMPAPTPTTSAATGADGGSVLPLMTDIRRLIKEISVVLVPLMKQVRGRSGYFYEDIVERYEELRVKSATIDVYLRNVETILLRMTHDASSVLTEADAFEVAISSGRDEEIDRRVRRECPFLGRVWLGDMYDASRTDGLKELKSDLEQTLAGAKITLILDEAFKPVA